MVWKTVSVMSAREEFVLLAKQPGANKSELCRRYGISRPTGEKWLARYEVEGKQGLCDRSRRPHTQPGRTAQVVEQAVVALRQQHPAWGKQRLADELAKANDWTPLVSPNTVKRILRDAGLWDATPVAAKKGA